MTFFYIILIHLFYGVLLPVSLINRKARLWISGRKNWSRKLKQWDTGDSPVYWFHAASLGEFEQGMPVMEALKKQVPDCKILLTFFSPSGYEIRKNYKNADFVGYLPLDTPYNARKFVKTTRPQAVFFIKYEFWYFYLRQLYRYGIPVYLISGIFRPGQVFFSWYGFWFRKQLRFFSHIFVQDKGSSALLKTIQIQHTGITGDTRFDRVWATAQQAMEITIARKFSETGTCIVAGSTWPADEEILVHYINSSPESIKFIIAPHEVDETHINRLLQMIVKERILFSKADLKNIEGKQVMIIDNIGMLSSLYQYGHTAYLGGGFGKGIHNLLEAAVFGIPVVFGPNHLNFREAIGLIETGGGFPIHTAREFSETMDHLINQTAFHKRAALQAKEYIRSNTGATLHIMQYLKENSKLHLNAAL